MEFSVEYLSGKKGATICSKLLVPLCNLTHARRHFPVFESMITQSQHKNQKWKNVYKKYFLFKAPIIILHNFYKLIYKS